MALVPALAALLALAFVPNASAFTQRPFKEAFGSAQQPSFEFPSGIVVDKKTGDVLIADSAPNTISRFHADGSAAPFQALGTNQIDGKEANGKPCAEEPASCDQTPQNEIKLGLGSPSQFQIAIDESEGPAKGDIYLTQNSGLVDIFSSEGRYLGQIAEVKGRPFAGSPQGVTVDPSGAVYVATNEGNFYKFVPAASPVVASDIVTTFSLPAGVGAAQIEPGVGATAGSLFVAANYTRVEGGSRAGRDEVLRIDKETGLVIAEFAKEKGVYGWLTVSPVNGNVITGDGLEYEIPTGSQPVRVGRLITKGEIRGGVAFGAGDEVFVGELFPEGISVYGPAAPVPLVTEAPAGEVSGTRAALTGTVDPNGAPPVTKCIFEYGKAYETPPPFSEVAVTYEHEQPCEGLNPAGPSSVHATLTGLEANGEWYGARLVAFNANGREETAFQTFKTLPTVAVEPASAVSPTAATLNGIVRPEGSAYSECFFEYGLASSPTWEGKAPCSPGAGAIPADFSAHEVKAKITGLQSGATYRFRLVATNASAGTVKSEEEHFGTFGLPRIGEVQASGADGSSVILEAKVNPSGFGTSYRFEWGQTQAYGSFAPVEFEPFVGSGSEPILVKAKLTGLAAGSTYHYRVTARSSRGVTQSADHVAETLNTCGLPQQRCFELVSRSAAGPVALPGEANAAIEMHFQAATSGPGALAYPVEGGYPESTKAADVLYRGLRTSGGWESDQLSPPISAVNERDDGVSVSSATHFLSDDLSCGVTESVQPLTEDASMKLVREEGAGNLYRINPPGSSTPYTGITKLPPEGTDVEVGGGLQNYNVAGVSQNCDTALFSTRFKYPGVDSKVGFTSGARLYEWRDGTLRNPGLVPGPGGDEIAVPAIAGGQQSAVETNPVNSVSEDGSRIFFTAERKASANPAEVGVSKAIFVREDGRETRDVSLSETAIPDEGAEYQGATPDGSRVFFTAQAGLTTRSNTEGTDLYEYNLETEKLTDRSVTAVEGGAQVTGVLGEANDGSEVYFASANQLVPGSGNSRFQNVKGKTFSIYGERAGKISFVGSFRESDRLAVVIENGLGWVSQVSPDGRYLLFESSAQVTGYENAGVAEAYLYDAASEETTCVSCLQDGQPSAGNRYGSSDYEVLIRGVYIANDLHSPRYLTERNGEPAVFFTSPDPLAPGAVAGQNNAYEWAHDQIFLLVSAPPGTQVAPSNGKFAYFGGASNDASDVYLVTPQTLTWQDGDERLSVYDARIGGGFAQPPAPPSPCRPSAENSCQGAPQGGPVTPGPATTGDSGAQNFEPKKKGPPKKKKAPPKKKHKKKNKGSKKKSKRPANGNRRNGK